MHAVVVNVSIKDRSAAEGELRDNVVPMVSGAPGFVAGYWVAVDEGHGCSVVVFESEEGARAVADRVASGRDAVSIDSVKVGPVVAHA
jgi:hypothetical protein